MSLNYSFMSFSTPELSLNDALAAAKRFGYNGFEPRLFAGHKHGIELSADTAYISDARRMAEEAGITICCLATSCVFADPNKAQEHIDTAKQTVDLAAKLGCRAIRVFGGNVPGGVPREKAVESVTTAMKKITDYAAGSVYICIETHDDWCDPDHIREVAKNSGCAVNWDIMHTILTAKYPPEKAFELLKPYIRHIHVHDGTRPTEGSLTFLPIGEGGVDHAMPIKLLKNSEYSGFISGEWIGWEPWETHLPRELATLKSLEGKG